MRRGPPRSSSGLLKWLYILAASTFVHYIASRATDSLFLGR
jgi:hypothetical protein